MVVDMRKAASEDKFPNMDVKSKTSKEGPYKPPAQCMICLKPCDNIGDVNKEGQLKVYCDLCLPPEYIKKSIRSWICNGCAVEATKLGDYRQ